MQETEHAMPCCNIAPPLQPAFSAASTPEGTWHEEGRQRNVDGSRAPSSHINLDTDGEKPLLHSVVQESPDGISDPSIHELLECSTETGAAQGFSSQTKSVGDRMPKLQYKRLRLGVYPGKQAVLHVDPDDTIDPWMHATSLEFVMLLGEAQGAGMQSYPLGNNSPKWQDSTAGMATNVGEQSSEQVEPYAISLPSAQPSI
jgi:hypothetical protein